MTDVLSTGQNGVDCGHHLFMDGGLHQIAIGASTQAGLSIERALVRAQYQHSDCRAGALKLLKHIHTIKAGHADIKKNQVPRLCPAHL